MNKHLLQKKETNYGVFTDISKDINLSLGDKTGRTVSRRTAHGLKNLTKSQRMDDDMAEFIVHMGMLLALVIFLSNSKSKSSSGLLLLLLLFVCYQSGKEAPKKAYLYN
jgi:hypothetical protein